MNCFKRKISIMMLVMVMLFSMLLAMPAVFAAENEDDAQEAPVIEWQKLFLAKENDWQNKGHIKAICKTSDGGYLLGMNYKGTVVDSESYGYGYMDILMIKTDENGNEVWRKLLGGDNDDYITDIIETCDGEYLAAGYSRSHSQSLTNKFIENMDAAPSNSGCAAFLAKLDEDGDKEWVKGYGTDWWNSINQIYSVTEAVYDAIDPDTETVTQVVYGYVFAGIFNTGQTNDGAYVYSQAWVQMVDTAGTEKWSITKGANNSYFRDIQQTADGGFILSGAINGNEPGSGVFNPNNNHSGNDYREHDAYMVKLEAPEGAYAKPDVEWEKAYGGYREEVFNSVRQTRDGGFIFVGTTKSADVEGGNHTINTTPNETDDVWVMKTGSDGAKKWAKCYGGKDWEYGFAVEQTSDGGYIIGADTAYSGSDGDLADTGNHGNGDMWLFKLEAEDPDDPTTPPGMAWKKCFGGSGSDGMNTNHSYKRSKDNGNYNFDMVLSEDGEIVFGGISGSTNGDLNGITGAGNKTGWLAKLMFAKNCDFEVSLAKQSPANPLGGQQIEIKQQVINNGPDAGGKARSTLIVTAKDGNGTAVDFADAVDETEVITAGGDDYSINDGTITIDLNNLALSTTRDAEINITTKEDFSGTLTLRSTVAPNANDITDETSANNTAELEISIAEEEYICDTYISTFIRETAERTYTSFITFGNKGLEKAENTRIINKLSKDVNFVSASPAGYTISMNEEGFTLVTWAVGELEPGYANYNPNNAPDCYYQVITQLKPEVVQGTLLKDTLNITTDSTDTDLTSEGSQNEKVTWYGAIPGLEVEIADAGATNETSIYTGEEYEIIAHLKNSGSGEAVNADFTFTVPEGMTDAVCNATDEKGNNRNSEVTANAENGTFTWKSNTLPEKGEIHLSIKGKMSSWLADQNFCAQVTAAAKAKSNIQGNPDYQGADTELISILRPDIEVSSEVLDTNIYGKYIHLEKGEGSATRYIRFDINNKGMGDATKFKVKLKESDPKGSITQIVIDGKSNNVSDLQVSGQDEWTVEINGENPYLGLYGMKNEKRYDTNGKAYFYLKITTEDGGYDFGHFEIETDLVFDTDDLKNAELDKNNNITKQVLDFISLNVEQQANGMVDPVKGLVTQQYVVRFLYKNTDPMPPSLEVCQFDDKYLYFIDDKKVEDDIISTSSSPIMNHESVDNVSKYSQSADISSGTDGTLITALESDFSDMSANDNEEYEIETTLNFCVKNNNNLNYTRTYSAKFKIKPPAPVITSPETGQMCGVGANGVPIPVFGRAFPNAEVKFFNARNDQEVDSCIADDEGNFHDLLDSTITSFYATAGTIFSNELSVKSNTVTLTKTDHCWCPQRTYWTQNIGGRSYTFKFRDMGTGRPSTSNWKINGVMGFSNSYLHLYVCCDDPTEVYVIADNVKYENYTIDGKFYIFNIKNAHNVVVHVECEPDENGFEDGDGKPDKEEIVDINGFEDGDGIPDSEEDCDINGYHDGDGVPDREEDADEDGKTDYDEEPEEDATGSITIDPDGYVFDSTKGWGTVVPGAKVTCMVYDPVNEIWYEWYAAGYNKQVNPQVVGNDGYFAFFTPPGRYRLVVENPSPYQGWVSPDIEVVSDIVHQNIPYAKLPEGNPAVIVNVSEAGLKMEVGTDASSISIQAGEIVKWQSKIPAEATPAQAALLYQSPVIHLRSLINPEASTKGFDSGLLGPTITYSCQFDDAGVYEYYYVKGNTAKKGTVVVNSETGEAPPPVETMDIERPTAPSDLTCALSGRNSVTLNWTAATDNVGVAYYLIFGKASTDESFGQKGTTTTNTFTDSGLSYHTAYQYYIMAQDAAGNLSQASNVSEATTDAAPSGSIGGSSTSTTISITPGVLNYKEMKIIEETKAHVRMTLADEVLKAQIAAEQKLLSINLENLDKTVMLVFSKEQIALITEKQIEIRLVTKYGQLVISSSALPQGDELELSIGKYLGEALLPEGGRSICDQIQFNTSKKLGASVLLILDCPTTGVSNDEEVFVFASNSPWRPLAIQPQGTSFKISITDSSKYLLAAFKGSFADTDQHWAKRDILLLNLKEVINGVSKTHFEPGRGITRGEFAAIIVRGLGLKPGTGKNPFTDVNSRDWYCEFIETAYEYGLISGYENGTYHPMEKITREQAMTMIAGAMKITDLDVEFTAGEAEDLLTGYGDSDKSAEWAKASIAACVQAGIVSGKSDKILAPKDEITRAEVAVIVRRLLQKSELF